MEKRSKAVMIDLEQQANAAFEAYKYEETGLKPCSYFWKELTGNRETPRVLIPDTLVINEREQPLLWVFTNEQGRVEGNSNVSLKDFVAKVTSYCSPNELTATLKRLTTKQGDNNFGNDVKLLNSRYLHNLSLQQLSDQVITIQKYVKSHGRSAFICRTVFTTETRPYCFLITNKATFYDTDVPQNKRFIVTNVHSAVTAKKATIVKSSGGKHLFETLPYLLQIVRFMRFQRGINLLELVGDFVKDESGNWWLVNVKAFRIEERIHRTVRPSESEKEDHSRLTDKQKYQKTKECRYCQKSYLQSELTHKMTRKMLIEMDRYLLHIGRDYDWLARSDANIDPHCLYQQFKICERCYRLYLEIQGLLTCEGLFLRRLGFQIEGEPKDLLMKLTNKEQLQMQSKDKQIHNLKSQIPEEISLGPNSSIITRNDFPLRNDETIHQMVRYRFLIYLHELDELTGVKPNHNYYFEFAVFGSKFKLKLDLSPKSKTASIKKLRAAYFFVQASNQGKSLQQYMAKNQFFKINLSIENRVNGEKRVIGALNLDMREYLGAGVKKSFYKFLDVQSVGYGWGLQGSIGLVRTQGEVNTSRLILSTEDRLIYLPSQHYYLCESLPQEWMDEIQNKNKNKKGNEILQTGQFMRGTLDTDEQFLPDHSRTRPFAAPPAPNWKQLIKKELTLYERRKSAPRLA